MLCPAAPLVPAKIHAEILLVINGFEQLGQDAAHNSLSAIVCNRQYKAEKQHHIRAAVKLVYCGACCVIVPVQFVS